MPLYEYHCSECGQPFEKMVRFSEVDLSPECPHCHSRETYKQISTIAARITGSALTGSATASNCSSSNSRFR
jgi:putative FmdB family regulatory protein